MNLNNSFVQYVNECDSICLLCPLPPPSLLVMNITLGQTIYSINESIGFIDIVLRKTDGAKGPVTVSLSTVPDTALGKYITVEPPIKDPLR